MIVYHTLLSSEHWISSLMIFVLTLWSSISLTNFDFTLAAHHNARWATTAEIVKDANLAGFFSSFSIASFRADNDLSFSLLWIALRHSMIPLGVMSTDESSASSPGSWSPKLWAESLFTLTSCASIILACWHLTFLMLERLKGSMLILAASSESVHSAAEWNSILNLMESRLLPLFLFRSSLGHSWLHHHSWYWSHHLHRSRHGDWLSHHHLE